MPTIVDKIEALHERLQRAKGIVADGRVSPVLGLEEHFTVASSTGTGSYLVNDTCSCWDAKDERRYELTRNVCKHKLAVIVYIEATTNEGSNHDGNDSTDEGSADDNPTSGHGSKRDNQAS